MLDRAIEHHTSSSFRSAEQMVWAIKNMLHHTRDSDQVLHMASPTVSLCDSQKQHTSGRAVVPTLSVNKLHVLPSKHTAEPCDTQDHFME